MMCWVSLCCHIRRHQSYLVKFCEFLTLIYSGTYICQTNLTRYVSCHPPPLTASVGALARLLSRIQSSAGTGMNMKGRRTEGCQAAPRQGVVTSVARRGSMRVLTAVYLRQERAQRDAYKLQASLRKSGRAHSYWIRGRRTRGA